MDLLLTYDVDTTDPAGRRRLRQVARICEGFGQRVQLSVFEMVVTNTQYVRLVSHLNDVITESDSIRLYRLHGRALDEVVSLGAHTDPGHRSAWII